MALLRAVARGEVAPEGALDQLALAPFEAVADAAGDVATLDHHRALRQGVPEVVYGAGKSPAQAVAIVGRLAVRGEGFLVTRADDGMRAALLAAYPAAVENVLGRTVRLAPDEPVRSHCGRVCIVTAGTADLPVAEECAETLRSAGVVADRVTDVGVAGVHRLLARASQLAMADVVIVIAGMDGALPSAVGGIVRGAVIAVPTSVGYGASFAGLAPLLTMLNSCAAGITVVNIDNGFGAAMAALRILGSRASSNVTPDASSNAKPGNEFGVAT
ncbi:1-(5-phosphoribosyl)-5-amino-4-imidazole-carboxyl ate carboxylase [Roseisolibacter agri]|uniref:1-(5-phosphoribosyl)-5-amino-4-imidazole-carboxyl ate carboxylase n=2 Tax=Roseisolibacter agri TaxID=2014610 RepID=A0AA37QBQ5_9BACT|nr:1-(5-phosphoribosyl)-5-amino-4-imidazole-carboxyl ate carboxylase [Roseisolibacter agri]